MKAKFLKSELKTGVDFRVLSREPPGCFKTFGLNGLNGEKVFSDKNLEREEYCYV